MPFYENVFIARQDILPPRVESLLREFSETVQSHGGKIGKTEYWGLRTMAYRISRMRKAHYAFLDMEAPHQAVQELEKQMRLHEDVLRFLTVRVSALDPEPSKPMEQMLAEERRDMSEEEGGEASPTEASETAESAEDAQESSDETEEPVAKKEDADKEEKEEKEEKDKDE